jgi:hypothetical protein
MREEKILRETYYLKNYIREEERNRVREGN